MTAFIVIGQKIDVDLDPRESLLDVLHGRLQLVRHEEGMRSRAVRRLHRHLDGRRVVSCLIIAVQAEGREVRTIEDVAAEDGTLHPLQQAFIDNDAMQCGYCTPRTGHVRPGVHRRGPHRR